MILVDYLWVLMLMLRKKEYDWKRKCIDFLSKKLVLYAHEMGVK